MYDLGIHILNLTMVVTTLWIVNKFLGNFFEKKKRDIISIILWIAYGVFQIYVEYHKGTASILITLICIFLVFLIAVFNFCGTAKIKLFIVMLFHVVWALVEMCVFYCMSVTPLEKHNSDMIGAVISKIIMIIGVFLFSVYGRNKNQEEISVKYYITLLFIPIGSIYIAVNEFYTGKINSDIVSSMIIFSILLLINLIIFELYSRLVKMFVLEREKAVYEQQIDIISGSTEEQKKIMENFHAEKHDLINQLIVLKDNVEHHDNVNVIETLNSIIRGFETDKKVSECGNKIVDAVINFKYAVASEAGIQFNLKIFIPEELPFYQCDIGIILGNAIDNAIEAVKVCTPDKRIINISMGIRREALVLTIKNYYEHSLKRDSKGNLLSTKEKQSKHGYGVKSIKRIIEKYQGEMLIEAENNLFSLTIVMNLK